jgi:hypothetical protein
MSQNHFTERLVVLVTVAQKIELTNRALAHGCNVGEYVRGILFPDEVEVGGMDTLRQEIAELRDRIARIEHKLEST